MSEIHTVQRALRAWLKKHSGDISYSRDAIAAADRARLCLEELAVNKFLTSSLRESLLEEVAVIEREMGP